jgi:hypothetical protein
LLSETVSAVVFHSTSAGASTIAFMISRIVEVVLYSETGGGAVWTAG